MQQKRARLLTLIGPCSEVAARDLDDRIVALVTSCLIAAQHSTASGLASAIAANLSASPEQRQCIEQLVSAHLVNQGLLIQLLWCVVAGIVPQEDAVPEK